MGSFTYFAVQGPAEREFRELLGGPWGGGGKSQVAEDAGHGEGIGQEGENAHLGAAVGAAQREDLLDATGKARPTGAGGAPGRGRRVGIGSGGLW
jgi:hypothetical protein